MVVVPGAHHVSVESKVQKVVLRGGQKIDISTFPYRHQGSLSY